MTSTDARARCIPHLIQPVVRPEHLVELSSVRKQIKLKDHDGKTSTRLSNTTMQLCRA
jgi:hypothetical protein